MFSQRIAAVLFCGALVVVTLSGQTAEPPQTALLNPRAIAANAATHRVYAVDQKANAVVAEDIDTGVATIIPVGKAPDALAVDAILNRIYVVNSGSDTVSEIDGKTQSVVATIPTGKMPYAIAMDSELHRVLVMNTYSPFATSIDETTNRASPLPLGSKDAVAIDSRRHEAWMLGYEDPSLTGLDETTGLTHQAGGAMHLWGLAVDENRGIVYATESQTHALLAIEERTREEKTIPVGALPCAIAIDTRTGLVYVLNYGDDSVTVVHALAGKVLATIPVGSLPEAIALDEQRNLIYVANTHSNSVSVIDGRTRSVVATLPAGRSPYAIAVDAERNAVYVANLGSPACTRLNLALTHP